MAKIGISEFTFGFAFLYEQTQANWTGLQAAPVLPSLHSEKDLGWDAKLPVRGVDFYYQFKLSDRLSRGNSLHIRDGTYSAPYLRFALHPKDQNNQHQRLRGLALANPHTYYVAPEFDSVEGFNTAFLAGAVKDGSRMINLGDCDDIYDGGQHYITFQEGVGGFHQHSEAVWHERSFVGRDLEGIYRATEDDWRLLDKSYAEELFDRTVTTVRQALEIERRSFSPGSRNLEFHTVDRPSAPRADSLSLLNYDARQASRNDLLMRVSQIASMTMGVTLVLVGAPA